MPASFRGLSEVARFEFRQRFSQPGPYAIGAGLFALWLVALVRMRHDPRLWGAAGEVHFNAPLLMQIFLSVNGVLALLTLPMFLSDPLQRDRELGTGNWYLSLPLSEGQYFWGRFVGGLAAVSVVLITSSLALIVAPPLAVQLGYLEAERVIAAPWSAYLKSVFTLLLLNAWVGGAVVYSAVALSRRRSAGLIASLGLLLGAIVANQVRSFHSSTQWLRLANPTGFHAVHDLAIAWPLVRRDVETVPLAGDFLLNRLIWLGVGALSLAIARRKFTFDRHLAPAGARRFPPSASTVQRSAEGLDSCNQGLPLPSSTRQFGALARHELALLAKDPAIRIVLLASLAWVVLNNRTWLSLSSSEPVATSIGLLRGKKSLWMLTFLCIPYFASWSIYRERHLNLHELTDSLPVRGSVQFGAKLLALLVLATAFPVVVALGGVLTQLSVGHWAFQWEPYFMDFVGTHWPFTVRLTLVSFAIAILVGSRALGFATGVLCQYPSVFLHESSDLSREALLYAYPPGVQPSELLGWAGQGNTLAISAVYWLSLGGLGVTLAAGAWPRGTDLGSRFRHWRPRGGRRSAVSVCLVGSVVGLAGLMWLEEEGKASFSHSTPSAAAEFERRYGKQGGVPKLGITQIEVSAELLPAERKVEYTARLRVTNTSDSSLNQCRIFLPSGLVVSALTVEGKPAIVVNHDRQHRVMAVQLREALPSGRHLRLEFHAALQHRGWRGGHSDLSLTSKGVFLVNDWLPRFGYDSAREVKGALERTRLGLGPRRFHPPYTPALTSWDLRIAAPAPFDVLAPGRRVQGGKGDYRFVSKRAEVLRLPLIAYGYAPSLRSELLFDQGSPVGLSIWHDARHDLRVDSVVTAAERALRFLSARLGPYPYSEVHVAEVDDSLPATTGIANMVLLPTLQAWLTRSTRRTDAALTHQVTWALAQHYWRNSLNPAVGSRTGLVAKAIPEYFALQAVEEAHGRESLDKFLASAKRRIKFRRAYSGQAGFSWTDRDLGGTQLLQLSDSVGGSVFDNWLRALLRSGRESSRPRTPEWVVEHARKTLPEHQSAKIRAVVFEDH